MSEGPPRFEDYFSGEATRRFDANVRARIPGYEVALRLASAVVAARVPPGDLLSVGCGTGADLVELARRPGWRVTGIDPAPDMLALAGERLRAEGLSAVELRPGTVEDLPDAPAYDAALLCFVLHFVPDDGSKERLLAGIARRLRPCGRLVLLDFCRTPEHAHDMAVLRTWLAWWWDGSPAEADAYLKRVSSELYLAAADSYPARARAAGFASAWRFHASLHVAGWLFEAPR
ncbi:MAG TPA: class I SAM-dependent methyltransferase [Anaeromyxobacteraceae bacterium]|nr:class I SAM-dependent methyltransferase [Anaeromyxobacteraceae bacterium]